VKERMKGRKRQDQSNKGRNNKEKGNNNKKFWENLIAYFP
jgi:hypothetical protein